MLAGLPISIEVSRFGVCIVCVRARFGVADARSELQAAHAYDRAARRYNEEHPERPMRLRFRPNFAEDGSRIPYAKQKNMRRGPLLVEDVQRYKRARRTPRGSSDA